MDLNQLWINVVKELSKDVKHVDIITWFKNTAALKNEAGVLTVGLPLPMFQRWHEERFKGATLKAAQKIDESIKEITYLVDTKLSAADPRTVDVAKQVPSTKVRKLPNRDEVKVAGDLVSKRFNSKYSLDNYIVAPENRLAHAACKTVAKYPGQNYNPLFIYGGVGLGKTHLLQATGREILQHDPSKVVVYVTSEQFVNELITHMRANTMDRFRNKYRKVDCLIIDDIQFMANKDRCQEEFFHTFNSLFDAGKQIIISSDRPPHELKLLSERLVSRFMSGMAVDVKMPDYETRLAILQRRSLEAQVIISQDVLECIAENCEGSVRELEGVLKQVIAKYELEAISPTVSSVKGVLHRVTGSHDTAPKPTITQPIKLPSLDELMESVADYFSVEVDHLLSPSRVKEIALPRKVVMYLAKTKLRMSLGAIGKALGGRNHTTVLHGVSSIESELKNDRALLCHINAIRKEAGIA